MSALVVLSLLTAVPIASPPQAVARLRAAKGEAAMVAAVKDVTAACRGKLRHSLRDHPSLHATAKGIVTTRSAGERKAALDLFRCFTPTKMLALLEPNLRGDDDTMIAYAAEVAARLESPETVPPMLEVLAERREACLAKGLSPEKVEVCVWLSYAPGPGLTSADAALRTRTGDAVSEMLASPYPKVREVAVETLAATKQKKYAAPVKALIAKEKKGGFEKKNDAALLGRFAERARALASGS